MKSLKFLILIALFALPVFAQSTVWKFDPSHSQVQFTVDHLVISEVTGNFKKFDGEVKSNGNDFSNAVISFTIDVNSIDTDNEKRDGHLKSDDFFNAEKFPKITFVGKSFKKVANDQYKLVGDMTMRDVTKQVELDVKHGGIVKDGYGNDKAGFKITGTLNRFDYNLKWNSLIETGGAVVGEDVDIICNIQLVKQGQS